MSDLIPSELTTAEWLMISAAWVQAVGSIFAIAAAVLIARGDRRKAAFLSRRERLSALRGVLNAAALSAAAPAGLLDGNGSWPNSIQLDTVEDDIRRRMRILESVPLTEQVSADEVERIDDMFVALDLALQAITKMRQGGDEDAFHAVSLAAHEAQRLAWPLSQFSSGQMARRYERRDFYSRTW